MTSDTSAAVSLRGIVGGGYDEFFRSQQRYVVVKGSRASKKSTSAALKIIVRMMQFPLSNTLVIRQTAESLKDSCYAQLLWAIDRLGVSAWWKARVSPLELEYTPTGQKILFRGLDNPLKVTSITVKHGFICFAWLEEAYEVDEAAWEKIDQSLRGVMPEGYYIQWLITFNPWDSGSWLKGRFFDVPDDDSVLAMTTTYRCNEWLSDADQALFERMRLRDPEQYKVAGLGDWGVAEGQFFRQWRSDVHVVNPFAIPDGWIKFRSMDWGSAAPYACLWLAMDYDGNMWVYRELYGWGGKPNVGTGETARQVGAKITDIEEKGEVHHGILDNACWAKTGVTGPSIAEELNSVLYDAHLATFSASSKGRAEMANAIKERLIGSEQEDGAFQPALRVFANCIHLIRTLPMLAHDKTHPETYDTKGEDHATDALGYACLSRPWTPALRKPAPKVDRWERRRKERPRSAWTY